MAVVDHERVLAELEAHVLSRPSHGQRDLLRVIAELRVKHAMAEGLIEKALRLLGVKIGWQVREVIGLPADDVLAQDDAMEDDGRHRSAALAAHGGSHEHAADGAPWPR